MLDPAVTFIVGENGSGKSTLLEAIAVGSGFNAEGGTRNFNFATRASHSALHRYLRVARGIRKPTDGFFLRAESFFNVATVVEDLGLHVSPWGAKHYGENSLHEQSHGESFLKIIMNRFLGNGLYILDEPEAALSPSRQFAILVRMRQLIEQGSQFIIATHSPIIMSYPGALIYGLSEEGLRSVRYEETEHFMLTRQFMDDPKRFLERLFGD